MMHFDEDTMKVKICKDCKGLGLLDIDDENSKCPRCGGTGRIIITSNPRQFLMSDIESGKIVYDSESMKIKICKACKGVGKVVYNGSIENGAPCSECDGYGRIVEYDVKEELMLEQIEDVPAQALTE